MARSFSSPNFAVGDYNAPRTRAAGNGFSNPKQAFSYDAPTNFNISASAGEGIAPAAGLVNLAETYNTLGKYHNYAEQGAALYGNEQAENRAFIDAASKIYSDKIKIKYAKEANKLANEYAEKAAGKQRTGQLVSAGLQTALSFAPMLLASDIETKHTIDQLEDALGILRSLRPVTFFYKEEYSSRPERMHYGFIAQEYQKVMPDQTYYDESIGKLCIDPVELIGVLVRAVQQLETKITRLEAKQALEGVK